MVARTTPIKTGALQTPTESNHITVLRQVKEAIEISQRLRGDPEDSYARIRELVLAGIARFENDTLQPPATLQAGDPGHGAGAWALGQKQAAAVALDVTHYVEIQINGTVVKLAVVT